MIITEDRELRGQMLDILKTEYALEGGRTGIHVSDLTHCLTRTYWDKTDPQPLSDTEVGLFSIGWGMERSMISRMHVEPFEVDGITMSLDFRLPDGTIADLKTTRLSPRGRKDQDGFQMPEGWLRQFAAYRYGWNALSEREVTYPKLALERPAYDFGVVVVHLIQPEITCWRVEWTPQELNNAWADLQDRANALESMLNSNDPQPYQHRLGDWECTGCSRALACGLAASLKAIGK